MAPAIKGEKKNDQVRREAPLYLAIICYWEERDSWAKHFKSLARIRGEIETKMQHQRSTNTNYRFLSYREKHTHTVRAASFSPFLKSRETRYMVAQKTKQKLSLRLSTEEMATFLFFFSLLNSQNSTLFFSSSSFLWVCVCAFLFSGRTRKPAN